MPINLTQKIKRKLLSKWPKWPYLEPSFVIVGSTKSGSTSLYYYLTQHPQILSTRKKELFYLHQKNLTNINSYYRFFPLKKIQKQKIITGEATPSYMLFPHSAGNIKQYFPKMKIIILLRSPKQRAYSEFKFYQQIKFIDSRETFKNLITTTLAKTPELSLENPLDNDDLSANYELNRIYFLLQRGHYREQIEPYEALFSKENILILKSEDFFANPQTILRQVFAFLAVDKNFIPKDMSPQNITKNKTILDKEYLEMEDFLDDYYREKNQKLNAYLSEKFNIDIKW